MSTLISIDARALFVDGSGAAGKSSVSGGISWRRWVWKPLLAFVGAHLGIGHACENLIGGYAVSDSYTFGERADHRVVDDVVQDFDTGGRQTLQPMVDFDLECPEFPISEGVESTERASFYQSERISVGYLASVIGHYRSCGGELGRKFVEIRSDKALKLTLVR